MWGLIGISEKFITTPTLMIPPIHSLLGRLAAWLERPVRAYPHTELVLYPRTGSTPWPAACTPRSESIPLR